MESLEVRQDSASKALTRLFESINRLNKSDASDKTFFRDSTIQRFEFIYEAFWKFLRAYMGQKLMVDTSQLSNGRVTFQAAHIENIITTEELDTCFQMLADRNQTSHTYDEHFAEELAERVTDYAQAMKIILGRITL